MIQRHNERLPRVGDSARLDRFQLTVVEESGSDLWIEILHTEPDQEDSR